MFILSWIFGAAALAAPPLPLFETMLADRAYVADLRATIGVPTARDYARARHDWPLPSGLCHRLQLAMEKSFTKNMLYVGHFNNDTLPDLPRILMRLEFAPGDMEQVVLARDRRTYSRVLNGSLRVTLLPSGREVGDVPLRFAMVRECYTEYEAFKSLRLLDLNGVRVTNGPISGQWDTVRHVNEPILLDALWVRDGSCVDSLFR